MIEGDLSVTVRARSEVCNGSVTCPLQNATDLLNSHLTLEEAKAVCEKVGLVRSHTSEEPILAYAIAKMPVAQFECVARKLSLENKSCGIVFLFNRSTFPGKA